MAAETRGKRGASYQIRLNEFMSRRMAPGFFSPSSSPTIEVSLAVSATA